MAIYRSQEPERDYVKAARSWVRLPKLDLKSKGLLAYIASHSPDYDLTFDQIVAENEDGPAAVRSGIAKLEKLGYLKRHRRRRGDGTLGGYDWEIIDFPEFQPGDDQVAKIEPGCEQDESAGHDQVRKPQPGSDQGKHSPSNQGGQVRKLQTGSDQGKQPVSAGRNHTRKSKPKKTKEEDKKKTISLSDGPSVPAARRADGNPRERDEEDSPQQPKPHHHIALAVVGITDSSEADRLKPRIEAASPTPIRNPAAWWRTMRHDPHGLAELLARIKAGETTYELVEARRGGVGVELSRQMSKAHAYFAMADELDARYGNDNRSSRNGHQPYRNPEPGAYDDWLTGSQPSLDPPEPTT